MDQTFSFGYWLKRRRKAVDLTQEELAQRVGCSVGMIRMIESDERRPSRQIAERLADQLGLTAEERSVFVQAARAIRAVDQMALPNRPSESPTVGFEEPVGVEIGQTIKGYELRECIGMGGFGAVYRADQPLVGREVAIKVILPEYANHPDFIRRFEAEAQMVARIEHLHIVPLYDYWREPDRACLVMRYMRGGNLYRALRSGPVSLDVAVRWVDQIAAALSFAHRVGVIHRDLKPDNILLDEEGNVYLADFGIAKDLRQVGATTPTLPGAIVGSIDYLAPEQLRGERLTPQVDIYSLGLLIYEMLTGARPFGDTTPAEVIHKQLHESLPSLLNYFPRLPEGLDGVIQRATAKDPRDRYPDVAGMAEEFRRRSATRTLITPQLVAPAAPAARDHAAVAATAWENPYKGLRSFKEADAADFFGREALTQRLLERMGEVGPLARFLAVVGPSGSGKSSVVRAGLVPALRNGALPGSKHWFIVEVTPGEHPLEELEAALLRVAVNPPPSLLDQLQTDERGLARAIRRTLPQDDSTELVLVIDQFEELFTLVQDEAMRAHILNSLCSAAIDPQSRTRIIVTMRADFYDRPLLYQDVGELMRHRTEVVLPLTPDELQQAIVRPAARVGVMVEPELVAEIVQDVGKQPGMLPLLQYALTELFERREEPAAAAPLMTLAAYRVSGGVQGALARRAEELYAGLGAAEQEAARQLFLRLVTPGEGAEDTRRRTQQSELMALGNGEAGAGAIATVLELYGRYRLLTFDHDPIAREPTVEVAHEALIRVWGRMRQWLDESRDDLRMQRRLALAAEEWSHAGHDRSFLVAGARLEQFAVWAAETQLALNQEEQRFLDASLAERDAQLAREAARLAHEAALERRSRNVLRALVVVLLLAALGALGLTGLAINQSRIARLNADEAQKLALSAGAQAASSQGNSSLAIALAMAATDPQRPLPQAELTLADVAYAPGTRQRFAGHTDVVKEVAFSPDGRLAVSASDDTTLILWEAATGALIRPFKGHTDLAVTVAFNPDGRTVLSGSVDKTLILWDIASGQAIRVLAGHQGPVNDVAFSPDGRTALSGSGDKTLILWDLVTGQAIRHFKGHEERIFTVAFSPDGRTALSGDEKAGMILWDVASGAPIRTFEGHSERVQDVAFSPDGKLILSGADDGLLIEWDLASGAEVRRLVRHTDIVYGVAFSPNGKQILSGADDGLLIVWDAKTGAELRRFAGHGAGIRSVAFSPDGRMALSGSADTTMRLWDLEGGATLRQLTGHDNKVFAVAFSPDGRMALSGSSDKSAMLWDLASGTRIHTLITHTMGVASVAFSPDGRSALTASTDTTLVLWDVETGKLLRRFTGHTEHIHSVAFSPDGRLALSGSNDMTLILWDVAAGTPIHRFVGHTGQVMSVAFSPDGRMGLSGSKDGTLRLWDLNNGTEVRRFEGHAAVVENVAFSPDGRTALSGSEDTTLILWDVAAGTPIRRFAEHNGAVNDMAFSPDGRLAISGSADRTLILWDLASGQVLRRFTGHTDQVNDVAFSPDGHAVLSGSADKTVRLWRVDSLEALIAWTRANRYIPDLTCEQRALYRLQPCDPL